MYLCNAVNLVNQTQSVVYSSFFFLFLGQKAAAVFIPSHTESCSGDTSTLIILSILQAKALILLPLLGPTSSGRQMTDF